MVGFVLLLWCAACCGYGVAHVRATPEPIRETADWAGVVALFGLSVSILIVLAL